MGLVKNSAVVMTGVILSNALAYAFHFIAGRMLGPDDYGVFGSLMAIFMIIALPAAAIGYGITKFTAKYDSNSELNKINALRKRLQKDILIIGSSTLLLLILCSKLIANYLKLDSHVPVIIVGLSLVTVFLLPVNRGVLQGLRKFKIYSLNITSEAFARVMLLVILLYLGYGVNGAIISYGLAYLIAFFLIFPFIKDIKSAEANEVQINFKKIYGFIFLVLIVNLVIQGIINIPTIFIKHYYTEEFTGFWTAALNVARISLFASSAIVLVMFPEIAASKDGNIQKKIFWQSSLLVLISCSGIAVIFFIFPQIILQLLYGIEFLGAMPLLKWMGVVMILIGLIQLWANYWLATKEY